MSPEGIITLGIQTSPSPAPPVGYGEETVDISDYLRFTRVVVKTVRE